MRTDSVPAACTLASIVIFLISAIVGLAQTSYGSSVISADSLPSRLLAFPIIESRFKSSELYSTGYGYYYLRNLIALALAMAAQMVSIAIHLMYYVVRSHGLRDLEDRRMPSLASLAAISSISLGVMLWEAFSPVSGAVRSASYHRNFGVSNFYVLNISLLSFAISAHGIIRVRTRSGVIARR